MGQEENERRMVPRGEDEKRIIQAVQRILKHELESRSRLVKNGENWPAYLWRTITPERIGLVVLLIFQLGGGVQEARRAIVESSEKAAAASAKVDAVSDQELKTTKDLKDVTSSIAELQKNRETNDHDMKDRISQSITRAEFNNVITQQILPRLARIEKRLGTQ